MARVRRALRSAQLAQSSTERKLRETRELFQRGIVPRNELDDPNNRPASSAWTWRRPGGKWSRPAPGQGENRQIAEMDLANASVKYETLQAQLDGRTVRAPFAGIVVAAPGLAGEQGSREPVQPVASWGRARRCSAWPASSG